MHKVHKIVVHKLVYFIFFFTIFAAENFLRAVAHGVHKDFISQEVLENYNLGTKSNITRLINVLTNKELIERHIDGIYVLQIRYWRNGLSLNHSLPTTTGGTMCHPCIF